MGMRMTQSLQIKSYQTHQSPIVSIFGNFQRKYWKLSTKRL